MLAGAVVSPAHARVDAQTFHPVYDGEGWIGTSSTATLPPGVVGFGLFFNYAMDPIQSQVGADAEPAATASVTTDLVTVDLLAAIGVLPHWDFGIDIPLSSIRNVAFAKDLDQFTFGIGDVRLGTKFTLIDRASEGAGLAVRGEITIPSGDTANFLGEEGVTFTLAVVGDANLGPLEAALDLGYLFRDESEGLGDAGTLRAALAWPLPSIALTPVVELRGSSTFDGFFSEEQSSPFEALVGTRWIIGESWFDQLGLASSGLALTTGVGFGLNAGIGSPEVRAVVGISPAVVRRAAAVPAVPATAEAVVQPDVEVQPEPDDDRDHDGVTDEDDVCPGLPETRNGYLDDDGCPDEAPGASSSRATAPRAAAAPVAAPVSAARPADSFPPIHFDSASGNLDAEARGTIERLSRALRSERGLTVRLTGHSDSSGATATNQRLARERAEQVRKALLARSGVEPRRVTAEGRGDEEPVASNADPEGRARNRRVEIELVRPE